MWVEKIKILFMIIVAFGFYTHTSRSSWTAAAAVIVWGMGKWILFIIIVEGIALPLPGSTFFCLGMGVDVDCGPTESWVIVQF